MPIANRGACMTTTRFTVLIERRRLPQSRSPGWIAALLLLMLAALVWVPSVAAPRPPHTKIARDLHDAVTAGGHASSERWARQVHGVPHVEAIVVFEGTDAEMNDLRAWIVRAGGTIIGRHHAVQALTVLIPASQLEALAQRDDVAS